MVGLVATAVCATYQFKHHSNSKLQLYASINEWQTGIYQAAEFSADTYLNGHIGTLSCIECEHPNAFHLMMAELYDLAR